VCTLPRGSVLGTRSSVPSDPWRCLRAWCQPAGSLLCHSSVACALATECACVCVCSHRSVCVCVRTGVCVRLEPPCVAVAVVACCGCAMALPSTLMCCCKACPRPQVPCWRLSHTCVPWRCRRQPWLQQGTHCVARGVIGGVLMHAQRSSRQQAWVPPSALLCCPRRAYRPLAERDALARGHQRVCVAFHAGSSKCCRYMPHAFVVCQQHTAFLALQTCVVPVSQAWPRPSCE
jgi:hypothetical protein